MKLNAWALVAVLVSILARSLLQHHPDWGAPLQSVVALTPLLPSLLYLRSIARWIGAMDELQRRIQLEACLFATTAMVFITTALDLLEGTGKRMRHVKLRWAQQVNTAALSELIAAAYRDIRLRLRSAS